MQTTLLNGAYPTIPHQESLLRLDAINNSFQSEAGRIKQSIVEMKAKKARLLTEEKEQVDAKRVTEQDKKFTASMLNIFQSLERDKDQDNKTFLKKITDAYFSIYQKEVESAEALQKVQEITGYEYILKTHGDGIILPIERDINSILLFVKEYSNIIKKKLLTALNNLQNKEQENEYKLKELKKIISDLQSGIDRQEALSAQCEDQIQRISQLMTRHKENQSKSDQIIHRTPVCSAEEELKALCEEIVSIDACLAEFMSISTAIPNDIPEDKEDCLKQQYSTAVQPVQEQLHSAKEARVAILNHYIDTQMSRDKSISDSMASYKRDLEAVIGTLVDGSVLCAHFKKKLDTFNERSSGDLFNRMCVAIDALAEYTNEMVPGFFTTGTHAAKIACADLARGLKGNVMLYLKGDIINEGALANEIVSTAETPIAEMKNRNIFSKLAKALSGIFEYIQQYRTGHRPDFFKPHRKELAEAVVFEAKALSSR